MVDTTNALMMDSFELELHSSVLQKEHSNAVLAYVAWVEVLAEAQNVASVTAAEDEHPLEMYRGLPFFAVYMLTIW